jgi:hypothetical protein
LGVGHGATNSTPLKVSCYETSHEGMLDRILFDMQGSQGSSRTVEPYKLPNLCPQFETLQDSN